MRAHGVVQAGAARGEAVCLGIVHALDQSHELAGDIAVEPGWSEGVFHSQDARREDGEIHVGGPGDVRWGGQYGKQARVGMVETDRAYGVVQTQIVFVGRVSTLPGNDVQRRVLEHGAPEAACKFGDQFNIVFDIFVPGHGYLEMPGIGQAVGAYGAELRQAQGGAEVLQHVAARGSVQQLDAEAHAARDDGNLAGLQVDQAQLCGQPQPTFLRHDQHLAVGVIEAALVHRTIGYVQADADAELVVAIAVARPGVHAIDEIGGYARDLHKVPAQAVGRHRA